MKIILFMLIAIVAAFIIGMWIAYLWGFYGPAVAIPGLLVTLLVIGAPILIVKSLRVPREMK